MAIYVKHLVEMSSGDGSTNKVKVQLVDGTEVEVGDLFVKRDGTIVAQVAKKRVRKAKGSARLEEAFEAEIPFVKQLKRSE